MKIRDLLWEAQRTANIPYPWNVNGGYLERVQAETVKLTVRECLMFLRIDRDEQRAADQLESCFFEERITGGFPKDE
jgi:hypothetical protein